MSYTFEHIDSLIARSLENSLEPEEQATLDAWLEQDEDNRRYYNALQKTWALTARADADFTPDTDRNWERFRQRMGAPSQVVQMNEAPRRRTQPYRNAWRIAATVLLLAGAATLYLVFLHRPAPIRIQTAAREKKELTLPDGSRVYLNQQSSLQYAKNLTGPERAIYLEGEAFFEVVKQEGRPFVVYANDTKTQVLGTSFDVKAYREKAVEVSVLSGKVAFSVNSKATGKQQADKLVLTTGRKVVFHPNQQLSEVPIADPNFIAWKENRLDFREMRLGDVTATLEEYYGVRIIIEDSTVANYTFKGNFEHPQLADVLNVIAAAANLTWTKENGAYKLSRK